VKSKSPSAERCPRIIVDDLLANDAERSIGGESEPRLAAAADLHHLDVDRLREHVTDGRLRVHVVAEPDYDTLDLGSGRVEA